MYLKSPLVFLVSFFLFSVCGQSQNDSIIATQGEGIFSILRKQGLDPVKYYPDFLELNADSLKNGSELVLGRTYLIPQALDSFKQLGIKINIDNDEETSIFGEELATFNRESEKLKDAVIYLMASSLKKDEVENQFNLKKEILKSVAKELLLNGAKVYLLEGDNQTNLVLDENKDDEENNDIESPMAGVEAARKYVDVVNKMFLKNSGKRKYQRLLVMDLNQGQPGKKYHKVSVFHDDNEEGARFANNMQEIFNKSKILDASKDFTAIFAQKSNLFLAKNALPPLTFIQLEETEDPKVEGRIKVKPDKKWLTEVITKGIVSDYADLEVQD